MTRKYQKVKPKRYGPKSIKASYLKKRMGKLSKSMGKPSSMKARGPDIVSDRTFAKLKYTVMQTPTSSSVVPYIYRGNSAYDPENIVGGAQPAGFDFYKQTYGRYIVHSSKFLVEIIGANAANAAAASVSLVATTDAASLIAFDPYTVSQQPYSKFKFIGNYGNKATLASYMSTAKMYGRPPVAVATETRFHADVTTNPADQWYWLINIKTLDSSVMANVYLKVTIQYYIEFYGRKVFLDSATGNPTD